MKPRLDAAALVFASLFPLAMAYLYFVALAGDAARSSSLLVAAYSVGKVIQFPFPLVYVFLSARSELGWPRLHLRGLAQGLVFALLVGVVILGLYLAWLKHSAYLGDAPEKVLARIRDFNAASPVRFFLLGFFICVIHSGLEEYYWRWFVFGWMRKYLPLGWAIALSSMGFMLHHIVVLGVFFPHAFWTLAMPFSLCVAVGGAVWAWLYHRSGELLGPWVSHALVDLAIMLVGYDMVRGSLTP
jgi:membrane protease YdiL (CAAX protease family)